MQKSSHLSCKQTCIISRWQEVNKMVVSAAQDRLMKNIKIIIIKYITCFIKNIVFCLATNHSLLVFCQTISMFPMAQVVDNSLDFFFMLSQAIFPTFRFNFIRQIRLNNRFLLWNHFKGFRQQIHSKFCNDCVRLCSSDSQREKGDNSDHAEMLLCKTADARMRIVIEEY